MRPNYFILSILYSAFAILIFTLIPQTAWAVDPSHNINQYGHRAWRVGEAGLTAPPTSFGQTSDGQIWVGTTDGLFRFDGKQFSAWKQPKDMPALGYVNGLLGASNGALYIASQTGVARIFKGTYFHYPKRLGRPGHLVQDGAGRIWVAEINYHGGPALCSVGRSNLHCYGSREGLPCSGNLGLAVASGGDLWVGGQSGICRWRPGRKSRSYSIGERGAPVTDVVFDARHSLWAGVAAGSAFAGLWNFRDDCWHRVKRRYFDSSHLDIWTTFGDRRGSIWFGAAGKGLYRLIDDRIDHFDHTDGLSADTVNWVFEDREGSIWIATTQGVDQFFDQPIIRFTARKNPLSGDAVWLTPSPDGAVLASDHMSSDKMFSDGSVRSIAISKRGNYFHTSFIDAAGRIWIGTETKLLMSDHEGGRVNDETAPFLREGMYVSQMAEDTHHRVWAAGRDWKRPPHGWLWRFESGHLVERIESPADAGHDSIDRIASDFSGGLWVAIDRHGLYHLRHGVFEHVTSVVTGIPITQILPVAPMEAWLSNASGATWLKNGHARVLNSASGLPCDYIYGIAFDTSGNLWLASQCDLVKVSAAELRRWQQEPHYRVHVTAFGAASGYVGSERSRLVKSRDGALWFIGGFATYRVDPANVPVNKLPPNVKMQNIKADQKIYPASSKIILPKLTQKIEIDYSGLSYIQPDLLTFRYILIGYDKSWSYVGNRREAFYNDLPPGNYTFQVSACNKDGFCSEQSASEAIVIPPAWWQTWLFKMFCIFAIVVLVAAMVRWRVVAYTETVRIRFDDRLQERTRVARELHDTLMQTVLASKFLAEGGEAIDSVAEGRATFKRLSNWLACAADEGRTAVESLRASSKEKGELADIFTWTGLQARISQEVEVEVIVTGEVRDMHPLAREEILRIGVEAIRNACVHSGADRVRIDIEYAYGLTLRIRDNGRGIKDDVLKSGSPGHFGLLGMRERAKQIGARLTISSSARGTEIELTAPGNVIFSYRKKLSEYIALFFSILFNKYIISPKL